MRILVAVIFIKKSCCQNGFNNRDMVGYQQMASNEGQIETITSYSTNIIQKDPSSQSLSSVNVQYHIKDDTNKEVDYNKANRGRSKKIYRIKNPFLHNLEETNKNEESTDLYDSGTAASNQYAAIRFSLPPDGFLQQLKADNQYNQQQQLLLSTLAPNLGYTATPQPQYQLSTVASSNYDSNNYQSNQFQLDPKMSQAHTYFPNSNYKFGPTNNYGLDGTQSTPSPVNSYISTPFSSQYFSTSVYPYISSSSPFFVSSPSNLLSYASTPLASNQANSPDHNNQVTSTIDSNSPNVGYRYSDKNMHTNRYVNNSADNIKALNMHQQFQNNYPSSSSIPLSTFYSERMRDSGQNILNVGVNALTKSLQELSFSQFQNYPNNNNNQQEPRSDNNEMNINSETHRMGNVPVANNVYLNYVQPDSQVLNTLKSQSRDSQQNSNQDIYSHGHYGWKLNDKKPLSSINNYSSGNYPKYSGFSSQSDSGPISQVNFHMDTGKNYNPDSHSRVNTENALAQVTMRPQENFKQQQHFYNNNHASVVASNNQVSQNIDGNAFYGANEENINKYTDGSNPSIYSFSSALPELITVSPYFYGNYNILDNKSKQSFDHAKALQNIVPIDVSNVAPNTDTQSKSMTVLDNSNRYNTDKEHLDQNINKYYRTLTDPFYKDKNTLYGFNIQTKPEDFLTVDFLKSIELNSPNTAKQQQSYYDYIYNPNTFVSTAHTLSYTPKGSSVYQENIHAPTSFQQQESLFPQNQTPSDIAATLKLNNVPHRFTQGQSGDNFGLHNSNYDRGGVSLLPRLNQNLGSHQLDVTPNSLNTLMLNKQTGGSLNRPEFEAISTINGYKVANPFNVDLRLVAEMLKGKPDLNENHLLSLKDQLNKLSPLKIDLPQLQLLLRNKNSGNLEPLSDSLSAYSNPYQYGSRPHPYQGVKYSRSQEEEENIIPIADISNTHPIGAVVEQIDEESENDITTGSDTTVLADGNDDTNFEDDRIKKIISSDDGIRSKHRHPNVLLSGRHTYQNKYMMEEPDRLLKPPPPQSTPYRANQKKIDSRRRRRLNKPKVYKILKHEPLYEDETETEPIEPTIPILLRPPPLNAEKKSDIMQAP